MYLEILSDSYRVEIAFSFGFVNKALTPPELI